jgi:hypothetical protein
MAQRGARLCEGIRGRPPPRPCNSQKPRDRGVRFRAGAGGHQQQRTRSRHSSQLGGEGWTSTLNVTADEQTVMTGCSARARLNASMKATLSNRTDMPVLFDGQDIARSLQPLGCTDALPAAVADSYLLVPACLGPTAHDRSDVVWSASIPACVSCTPPPGKRRWFWKPNGGRPTRATVRVIEHYTAEDGRQGVGAEFFRKRYLD